MDYAEVTDLYEAAYLIIQGNRIEGVQCIPFSESLGVSFSMAGEDLYQNQETYLSKAAVVNVHAFRSAYNQVNKFMHEAKRSYDRERRESRRESRREYRKEGRV